MIIVLSTEAVLFSEGLLLDVSLHAHTSTQVHIQTHTPLMHIHTSTHACTHTHTYIATLLTTPTFFTSVSGNEFSYIGKYTYIYTSILVAMEPLYNGHVGTSEIGQP